MEIRKARYQSQRAVLRGIVRVVYLVRSIATRLHPSKIQHREPRRIALFVSMELLGGGVIISAVAKLLKNVYPQATLTVVGEQHRTGKLAKFFEKHTCVDGVFICPRRGESTFLEWIRFYWDLKRRQFDVCVLSPNHSCSNSVFLYLCGIKEIIGAHLPETWPWHAEIENRFITRPVTKQHMTVPYRLLAFPEAYGRLLTGRKDFKLAELLPLVKFRAEALPELASHRPKVTMHPGGPPHKRWPAEKYVELGKMLALRYDAALLIVGGQEESSLAAQIGDEILRECPWAEVHNCSGCAMNHTINFVARSVLYVGNNAGTMQIPAALGVPVVGLFPESDRWFSGPEALGEMHRVIAHESVEQISVADVEGVIKDTWPRSQLRSGVAHTHQAE
jgi:ADP-heptose:LPS heptosyltransferase